LKNYSLYLTYHPKKANVSVDVLSKKNLQIPYMI